MSSGKERRLDKFEYFLSKFSGLGNKRQSKISVKANPEAKDPNTTSPEMSNVHDAIEA